MIWTNRCSTLYDKIFKNSKCQIWFNYRERHLIVEFPEKERERREERKRGRGFLCLHLESRSWVIVIFFSSNSLGFTGWALLLLGKEKLFHTEHQPQGAADPCLLVSISVPAPMACPAAGVLLGLGHLLLWATWTACGSTSFPWPSSPSGAVQPLEAEATAVCR